MQEFNRDVNTKVNEHTGYDLGELATPVPAAVAAAFVAVFVATLAVVLAVSFAVSLATALAVSLAIGLVLLLLVLVVAMIAVPVIAVIAILYNSPFALFLPPLESCRLFSYRLGSIFGSFLCCLFCQLLSCLYLLDTLSCLSCRIENQTLPSGPRIPIFTLQEELEHLQPGHYQTESPPNHT